MRFIYLLVYHRTLSLNPYFLPYIYCFLSQVIAEHDVEHHLHADDTHIYISLSGSEALESSTDFKSCVTCFH